MDEAVERRVADERHRIDVSQRLAAIETSGKLYHDEIKSITEKLYAEIKEMKNDQQHFQWTLYGGPGPNDVGLLERLRALMWKAGIATTVAIGFTSFMLRLFAPSLNKVALKLAGVDETKISKKNR